MANIKGGELILKCLQKEGVKHIIAITDEGYHAIQHKCADYGMRFVSPRHEAAAAHIAQGIFKATGEISAVLGGGGPGTANLLSGVICAESEGVPMLVITAQRRKEVVYPSQVGVFQGTDQLEWFRPVTKWNAVVHEWQRIPEIVSRAFRETWTGRPGPVHIDVPESVMNEEADEDSVQILEPHQYRSLVPPAPSSAEIEEIASLLEQAERPLVMAGTGVLNSGAWDDYRALVEALGCPSTTSMAGRTALSDDHPNNLLPYSAGSFSARREADVVVTFGTCLGELDLPWDKYWGDETQKIVQVDIDPRNLGAHRALYRGVVADAGAALRALVEKLRERGVQPEDGARAAAYRAQTEAWCAEALQPMIDAGGDETIHPVQSILAANEVFPQGSINIADGGNTSLFNMFFSRFSEPRTSQGNAEFGHLGTGIPSAIGAKLARPDADVFCISGDGAAGFNIMELETAVRENVKITVIVHAEGSWAMEEIVHLAEGAQPEQYRSALMGTVRWDEIAKAVGCHGEYVEKSADLVPAMQRARDAERPALVCVKTDRQATLIPPGLEQFGEVYSGA
jgi:acetolactate synthase-1/2/3 large subunit